MCDGRHSSKRDVVILSIKPKRPEYSSKVKVVPVSELLQEWDKLDAYYRGQLLKLTKSISKQAKQKHSSRHSVNNSPKVSSKNTPPPTSKPYPVNKKTSSLSSDQFTELFGDENLFSPGVPADNNNNSRSQNKNNNKLLHSRSLNSLFDEDLDAPSGQGLLPPSSRSRKSSLSSVNSNTNLVVSIPVLSVHPHRHSHVDNYSRKHKWASDDEDDDEGNDSGGDEEEDEEPDNFLSVPRDNFQVQYGTKQKTRVTLLETGGSVSPRWIVPIRVAPYKPPTAQGLNGIQIQKILYHKNDSVNFASPTTTAKTPDKPPDSHTPHNLGPITTGSSSKSAKLTESPASTVSPRSTLSSGSSWATATPTGDNNNNNATPKQTVVQTPELLSPQSDLGNLKPGPSPTAKSSSPPVNSTTGQKLKRPVTLESHSLFNGYGNNTGNSIPAGGKKRRFERENSSGSDSSGLNNFIPVTSTSSITYAFNSSGSHGGSTCGGDSGDSPTEPTSPKKVNNKNLSLVRSNSSSSFSSTSSHNSSTSVAAGSGDHSGAVFVSPAAVSITDRIIKKATRPQPELIERQRRRRLESNQRKTYAMQKGDEHEERESIDLSMKSFEMIWNVPLLSPLRSP